MTLQNFLFSKTDLGVDVAVPRQRIAWRTWTHPARKNSKTGQDLRPKNLTDVRFRCR